MLAILSLLLSPELQRQDNKNDISEDFAGSWKIIVPSEGKCDTDLGICLLQNEILKIWSYLKVQRN